MNVRWIGVTATILGMVVTAGWVQTGRAEVPLGSPDFYPSHERPIGFRGDGNGFFPGATPVTTWRDGDADWVEMDVEQWGDAGGNQRGESDRAGESSLHTQHGISLLHWRSKGPLRLESSESDDRHYGWTEMRPNDRTGDIQRKESLER